MKTENLITVNEFCIYHNVEFTFINSLQQAGLVDVKEVDQTIFIPESELKKLQKIISLHELDINIAGIEAITHMLDRIEQMQENMRGLRNKLKMYEGE
ncbi:chaperone modulator CbpM [Mucilaginibacter ginsenosidivorax]|uniref:MerR family transcriptional regulator n=1 Tax=Mucilaginibacter ginsenosidivorax TaxID=862126 RepID=A0A5B8WBF6_9SPHI|nr:chaperone modulator CbpM [Mucilaginibacter ginsenosidivorax]QEC80175.1 MerR family transcriptional regulator [Mucilaginibacter ginsenosidivorax]